MVEFRQRQARGGLGRGLQHGTLLILKLSISRVWKNRTGG
jgi:hypothetical protein